METPRIEFFFDLASPWTRIAFHNIQMVARRTGARIEWRPFLVGGVFNAVNESVYASRAAADGARFRQVGRWLDEWAAQAGIAMRFPAPSHPLKSVNPMRVCCVLEADQHDLFRFANIAFEAYFKDQRDLDDPIILAELLGAADLDAKLILEVAQSDRIKARLRTNTDEAISRGAFGSPSIFVDREFLYFGNDQLPLVEWRLGKRNAAKTY